MKAENDVPHNEWQAQLLGIPEVDVCALKERLSGRLKPRIELHIDNVTHGGKNYVVISINHPHDTLVSTSSGKTYIRDGRSSRPMEPDEIQRCVKALVTYDWTADVLDLSVIDVLDQESLSQAFDDFRQRRKLTKSSPTQAGFLEAIGATRDGALTKGGLLISR